MTLGALVALLARPDALVMGLVLCAETRGFEERVGARRAARERAAIVEVARGRARASGSPLAAVLLEPGQFATSCPAAAVPRFRRLAADLLAGHPRPPAWARRAVAFAAPAAARKVSARWRRWGWTRIRHTGTVHVFFECR